MRVNYKYFSYLILILLFATCDDILEEDLSNQTINLLAPADQALIPNDTVSFWWDPVDGATYYELHIVSPSIDNPVKVWIDSIVTRNLLNFELPTGDYEWEIRAYNSGYSTDYFSRSFSVGKQQDSLIDISSEIISLLSPIDSGSLKEGLTTFWWEQLNGAQSYQLQIVSPSFQQTDYLVVDTSITTNKYAMNLTNGNYQWRVMATNEQYMTPYSTRSIIIGQNSDSLNTDISNEKVQLLAPSDSAMLYGPKVTLWWDNVDGAQNYQLQIVSPTFESANQLIIDTTLTKNQLDIDLPPGKYEWKVKGSNVSSSTLYSSRGFQLDSQYVEDISTEQIVLRTPGDSLKVDAGEINFWWDEMPGVTSYKIIIVSPSFDDNELEQLVFETEIVENKITVELDSGQYEWGVKGQNSRYESDYSIRRLYVDN